MFNLTTIFISSENPKRLAKFYEAVFETSPGWQEGDYNGYKIGDTMLLIGSHDKVRGMSKEPERVMFNVETRNVEKEYARIKGLGTTIVSEPYHPGESKSMTIATFADPDGNYFQLMTPMKM